MCLFVWLVILFVASDVFNKFKIELGVFKQELSRDAKGLLCLYEASCLGTCEEVVLGEAMEFARNHMELLMVHTNNVLCARCNNQRESTNRDRRAGEVPTR